MTSSIDRSGLSYPDALYTQHSAQRIEVVVVMEHRKATLCRRSSDHVVSRRQAALTMQLARGTERPFARGARRRGAGKRLQCAIESLEGLLIPCSCQQLQGHQWTDGQQAGVPGRRPAGQDVWKRAAIPRRGVEYERRARAVRLSVRHGAVLTRRSRSDRPRPSQVAAENRGRPEAAALPPGSPRRRARRDRAPHVISTCPRPVRLPQRRAHCRE